MTGKQLEIIFGHESKELENKIFVRDEDFEVIEYYNIVAQILSIKPKYKYLRDRPTGAQKKLMDSSLSKKFNWLPKIRTIKGIEKLYEYEKNLY